MKRLFLFLLVPFLLSAQSVLTTVVDTVRFTRPADTLLYAAGDIIAGTGGATKYLTFSNIGSKVGARGTIKYVSVSMDTANSTNATVKLRLFTVSDTTGLWASLPLDNAAFQSPFQTPAGQYLWFGDVSVTLGIFGTTAGGATTAEGVATATIPYKLLDTGGELYGVLIATGAFEPKSGGIFKIAVWADRQY